MKYVLLGVWSKKALCCAKIKKCMYDHTHCVLLVIHLLLPLWFSPSYQNEYIGLHVSEVNKRIHPSEVAKRPQCIYVAIVACIYIDKLSISFICTHVVVIALNGLFM